MSTKEEKSHIKLVQTQKNLESINDNNIENVLQNLKTKQGKDLSTNYKISILRTIKKYNKNITRKPKQLKFKSTRFKDDDTVDVKKIIVDIIKQTYELKSNVIDNLRSRAQIDAYIAILIITSCYIRVVDLYELRMNDLNTLLKDQSLVKNHKVNINGLFARAEPLIRELVEHRKKDMDEEQYNENKLITCSSNNINKILKTLCEETSLTYNNDIKRFKSIGISKFKFKQPNILSQFIS
ncbi:VLF-1 [Aratus pisonii nudivirus]|nr:VLF-1 [Aratus pisonii nudivirus]